MPISYAALKDEVEITGSRTLGTFHGSVSPAAAIAASPNTVIVKKLRLITLSLVEGR
ncbi:MAG: hypothetical protein LAP61_22400 [Acidobacteriia bacterium]|nr:hypothetical protein [Terriglobia bacterium]